MYSCKKNDLQSELLLEALGPNLKKLKSQCPAKKFCEPTCYEIALQLLDRLEALHSLNFVHNDLKFENIVIGNNDPEKIYLIDFGLTQTFVDESGGHLP